MKVNQRHVALVHSDNDPFIPLVESTFIADRLDPTVILVPGGKHFVEKDSFSEILEYIVRTYS